MERAMPEIDIGLVSPNCTDELSLSNLWTNRRMSKAQIVASDSFQLDSDVALKSLSPALSRRSSDEISVSSDDTSVASIGSSDKSQPASLVFFEDGTFIDISEGIPGKESPRLDSESGEEDCEEGADLQELQDAWELRIQDLNRQLWTHEQTIAHQEKQMQEKDDDIKDLKAEIDQCQMEANDAREAMERVMEASSHQARIQLQAKIDQQEVELDFQREKLRIAKENAESLALKNEQLQKMLLNTCQLLQKKSLAGGSDAGCKACGRQCNCLPMDITIIMDGIHHFVM